MIKKITIVGGGPVGLIFAALLNKKYHYEILDAPKKSSKNDERALALSNGSRLVFEEIGIWREIQAKVIPINEIHTSQKGSFGRSLFTTEDTKEDALGYIISYADLLNVLKKKVKKESFLESATVEYINTEEQKISFTHNEEKKISSFDLLVLADGGQSKIDGVVYNKSEQQLNHDALVTIVKTNQPHKNRAFERFTTSGPLALLPFKDGCYSLVWTAPMEKIRELEKLHTVDFLNCLQEVFGDRVGKFIEVGKKTSFPLMQSKLEELNTNFIIAIGNAAQIMHPVAGQGLNMGVQDAYHLFRHINDQGFDAAINNLDTHIAQRQKEKKKLFAITGQLASVFNDNIIGINRFRGLALLALSTVGFMKRKFIKKMSYGK